ncbi:hypothetical protein MA16_Dca013258 [Dendrobium catenatum]|uniref:Uncharacterized protein n=1 Tax=Dendrobium catenatum TaxID=906689 RepID=A0A2I0WDD9_9ASPA|nr:hypothetical protein MA16_Dca013258 [Dendrobium catenatum]
MANLKDLNRLLLKDTVERREQIHQLRSELSALAADRDILNETERDVCGIVLSSSISDAAETAGKMLKKAESIAAELNAAEMQLVVVAREKDRVESDLERLTEERDLKMEVLKSQKDVDMDTLNASNKANASKVEALEEECRLLKETICQLENEAGDLKVSIEEMEEENLSLVVRSEESEKEKLELEKAFDMKEKEMALQINELKITIEQLQRELNRVTAENEEAKKQIDCSKVEKASLKKHLETSNQRLQDAEKKLKALEDSSGQVFALFKKMTAEVRTQENHINRVNEIVEVDNDEERKLFVDNLEAIKVAVKRKETIIKDLNQKLELLQLSVAHEKNKMRIWKWLFPATTGIFAAASLAYAAKQAR